jgi:hypothetical protein
MLFSGAGELFQNIYIFTWDALLALVNVVTPNKKLGTVVPHGLPGAGGKWPEFVAPKEGDSRSCCPALNALANHGEYDSMSTIFPFLGMARLIAITLVDRHTATWSVALPFVQDVGLRKPMSAQFPL